jgi:hypothetical protein
MDLTKIAARVAAEAASVPGSMTVGQLRAALASAPDDAQVGVLDMNGWVTEVVSAKVDKDGLFAIELGEQALNNPDEGEDPGPPSDPGPPWDTREEKRGEK